MARTGCGSGSAVQYLSLLYMRGSQQAMVQRSSRQARPHDTEAIEAGAVLGEEPGEAQVLAVNLAESENRIGRIAVQVL